MKRTIESGLGCSHRIRAVVYKLTASAFTILEDKLHQAITGKHILDRDTRAPSSSLKRMKRSGKPSCLVKLEMPRSW